MEKPKKFINQKQSKPGLEYKMDPQPEIIRENYRGSKKLQDKSALIKRGDSWIWRSVAVHFTRETIILQ